MNDIAGQFLERNSPMRFGWDLQPHMDCGTTRRRHDERVSAEVPRVGEFRDSDRELDHEG